MAAFALVLNTNLLELSGLKSEIDDTFINDAAVSVTLKDAAGAEVAGVSWPVTLDYVAASSGNYRGVLSSAIEFTPKAKYKAFIEVDAGADRTGHWEFPFQAITRTGDE